MEKPFEDLLVIELTTYWAATSAGRYLRSQGARVIKVEAPPTGDSVRSFGRTCRTPYTENENPIHDLSNGGKECIALNLKEADDRAFFDKLLAKADIFITSTRMSGLKKMGLSYDDLKDKFPRLIMAHVTGWGMSGPMSNLPGLDAVSFFGINGLLSDNLMVEGGITCPITGMGDFTTGGFLDVGILTALYNREKTGRGDYVMTSLYGVGGWVSANCSIGTQYYNPWPRNKGTQSPMSQAYMCSDGKYVQLFVNEYEKFWNVFVNAFKIDDLRDDARVNTRVAVNAPASCKMLADRCHASAATQTSEELLAKLRAGGIPSVILGKFSDKYTIPDQIEHNLANGYFVEHTYDGEGASGRTIYVNQFPMYFESQGVVNNYEPCHAFDQDGDAIRKEFG